MDPTFSMEELPDLMSFSDSGNSDGFDAPLPLFDNDTENDLDGLFDLDLDDGPMFSTNSPSEMVAAPPASEPTKEPVKETYKPEAEKYSEKLKRTRKPLEDLLLNECVQYGLVDRSRAEYLVRQLPGKDPREAEKEVVVELRNNLYEQVRGFLREYKGGPWKSPNLQEEVRLDIVSTPSVRSLLSLMLQLVKEQRDWLKANNKGLNSKLFGNNIKFSVE